MKRPILLICQELTNILENNINEIEQKLYKIKEDDTLREPIFLYSYSMFEGAITMLITEFCNAFPEKMPKEVFLNLEKSDLLDSISNKEAINSAVERFVMKITYGNIKEWFKELNEMLGLSITCNVNALIQISEIRNILTHNNRNNK